MLIYKSRVFDLHSTNVSSRRAPFEYLGHAGSCAALLIYENEESSEVGLLAHHRPAIGHTLFELPSSVLKNEITIEDVMKDELRDALGMQVATRQLNRLTALYSSPGYSSELVTIFLVLLTQVQRLSADSLRWFPLLELNSLIATQEIIDMKTVAAITAYQAILWKGQDDEVL